MKSSVKRSIWLLLTLAMLLLGLLTTLGYWLPAVVNYFLPQGVSLTFANRPQWQGAGLQINSINLQVKQCTAATGERVRIGIRQWQWQLTADKLVLDSHCITQWPMAKNAGSAMSLTEIQRRLPKATITVAGFSLKDVSFPSSKLVIHLNQHQQDLQLNNSELQAGLQLSANRLAIVQISYQNLAQQRELHLQGSLTLADVLTSLPEHVDLSAEVKDSRFVEPLALKLKITDQDGILKITAKNTQHELLELPLRLTADGLEVVAGKWSWPFAEQALQGMVSLSLQDWHNLQQGPILTARANLITSGKGGKGNLVVSAGPARLTWQNNALPLQLTGVIKALNLQIYSAMPAVMTGLLTNPTLRFKSGALLRARGEILPGWIVDEARFPLAGVRLESRGLSGPLQGNFKVRNLSKSFYLLHLAGQAQGFLPNKGRWDWRYWGRGKLLPLQAEWDIAGRGYWQDQNIKLTELTTGFDQLQFHGIRMTGPRLDLLKPIHCSLDKTNLDFSGALRFTMQTTHIGATRQLPPARVNFELQGQTPNQFRWKANLHTAKIGPIQFSGRRNQDYWLGRGIWPEQALTVIQPLLGDKNSLAVRQGTMKGAIAFSIQPKVGLQIGGHWRVKNGEIWTPNNRYRGVQFSLPFRYLQGQWQLGPKAPIDLFIAEIDNQTTINNVHAELQGFYPFSRSKPLRLTRVNLDLLGGRVHLAELALPQQQAANLKFSNIDLSKLISLLHPSKFALSGHINAELPFWIGKNSWKITQGWLSNAGDVTLRMDKELIDSLIKNNLAAGVALDWLRYMEINKLAAQANVDEQGWLNLAAQVAGTSEFDHNRQRVRLNYTHQQNILTLWQSLSFANNLESWLTENLKLPENNGNKQ